MITNISPAIQTSMFPMGSDFHTELDQQRVDGQWLEKHRQLEEANRRVIFVRRGEYEPGIISIHGER